MSSPYICVDMEYLQEKDEETGSSFRFQGVEIIYDLFAATFQTAFDLEVISIDTIVFTSVHNMTWATYRYEQSIQDQPMLTNKKKSYKSTEQGTSSVNTKNQILPAPRRRQITTRRRDSLWRTLGCLLRARRVSNSTGVYFGGIWNVRGGGRHVSSTTTFKPEVIGPPWCSYLAGWTGTAADLDAFYIVAADDAWAGDDLGWWS